MARPTIIFNTSTGSATAASGAGPATAVSGTGASLNSTTSVDLSADSPDLSGVATDGSAALWVGTSSGRQFARITAVDNGTKVVTVATAYSVTESGKNWGIGGKRNSWDGSRVFIDALPGWTIQTETDQSLTAAINIASGASGDTTDGPIIVCGDSASTRRLVTQTANAAHLQDSTTGIANWRIKNLKFQNSNGTKTSANVISMRGAGWQAINCIFGDATNTILNSYQRSGGSPELKFVNCLITDCTGWGIDVSNSAQGYSCRGCVIRNCASGGLDVSNNCKIINCIIHDNSGDGINCSQVSSTAGPVIEGCTIHGNSGDGIDLGSTINDAVIMNCNITGNGAYGITGASGQDYSGYRDYNNFGTGGTANTSGAVNNVTIGANSLQVDPGYTDAANDDFSVGVNVKAAGFPDADAFIGANQSATTSYVDIGAAQRQEPAGGSGGGIRLAGPGGLVGMGF